MLYELTIPTFTKMLRNLSSIMNKGETFAVSKKIEMSVLLNSRLAPDQFHLTRQIQIACDTAKLCASRLTGKPAPIHEDSETTWPQLKARIDDVVSYLNSFSPQDFEGAQSKQITQPRWEGKWLSGQEFALQHAIPNLHFHITTAYSILRHNGVDVGKKDFLGEMPFKQADIK